MKLRLFGSLSRRLNPSSLYSSFILAILYIIFKLILKLLFIITLFQLLISKYFVYLHDGNGLINILYYIEHYYSNNKFQILYILVLQIPYFLCLFLYVYSTHEEPTKFEKKSADGAIFHAHLAQGTYKSE